MHSHWAGCALLLGWLCTAAGLPVHCCCDILLYGDFKKHINVLLKRKWQSQWDEAVNNKLHAIHPQLGLWPGGSRIIRREESVLTRIRIGHTHLTHCFLLKEENPPQLLTSSTVLHLTHMVTLTDLLIPATQHSARC